MDLAEGVRLAIRRVYLWMAVGLFVTAAVAYTASTLPRALLGVLILPAIILELVVVIGLSALINKLSPAVASLAFFFYAALNGITLSVIFLVYTGASIAFAFAATASMFAAMSIVGYTTKTDLTKFGSLLFMGLIGLIVASVINIFLASSALYWIISFAGVVLFVGLTAYDTQRIKTMTEQAVMAGDTQAEGRVGVMGALRLYLDFVNLFLMILRIAGGRRK
ncbi:MAG: Bax inhibitor-1/YccA family protein [Chloroflexota bacterium]